MSTVICHQLEAEMVRTVKDIVGGTKNPKILEIHI
jgi:hypothetical protein